MFKRKLAKEQKIEPRNCILSGRWSYFPSSNIAKLALSIVCITSLRLERLSAKTIKQDI